MGSRDGPWANHLAGITVQEQVDVTVCRVAVKDLQERLQAFGLLNKLKVPLLYKSPSTALGPGLA